MPPTASPVEQLLERLNSDTPPTTDELRTALGELTPEELTEFEQALMAAADERLEGDQTDAVLAELDSIASSLEVVHAETEAREAAAADRAERAEELRRRIHGDPEASDTGDETDETEGDDDAAGDEGESEGDTDGDDADDGAASDTRQPETVAASAPPRLGRVAARRPEQARPRPNSGARLSLVAAANVPGLNAGSPITDESQLAEAFIQALQASGSFSGRGTLKIPVAQARVRYPDGRFLDRDPFRNQEKVDAVTSYDAITAAGGICAPTEVRYDLPTVGVDDRPVRDGMLTRFGADRGGVRTLPIPTLSDVAAGVDVWTEANDQTPADPTTKPCVTMTCDEETETVVEAITQCLKSGNFRQRFFPEQVAAWVDLLAVQHARLAESRLLKAIGDGSTAVTAVTSEGLSATRDVLAVLDRAIAGMRYRFRGGRNFPLRAGFPVWLLDMIRTDLARELPGSSDERLAMADAQIEAFFRVRNVNITWHLDAEEGTTSFGAQGDAALVAWPDSVVGYLYPEGSWLFLDGGMLDLGVIRDGDLVGTNDFKLFSETFEGAHFHGVESLRLDLDICPSGATAAANDYDPCTIGS